MINNKKSGGSETSQTPYSSGGGNVSSVNDTNSSDKITFDGLKRYAKTSFNSALTNAGFHRPLSIPDGSEDKNDSRTDHNNTSKNILSKYKLKKQTSKSKFYETDNLRETLYIQDSAFIKSDAVEHHRQQTVSPYPSSEHIYEEIEECNKIRNTNARPLPPIPEGNKRKVGKIEPKNETSNKTTEGWIDTISERQRSGSIFEGKSKYDILHYLNSAKDRLESTDFEIEKEEQLTSDPGITRTVCSVSAKNNDAENPRNTNNSLERNVSANKRKSKSHRISSISNASDCSTASNSSGNSQYSSSSINEEVSSDILRRTVENHQDDMKVQNVSPINVAASTCGIVKPGWIEIDRADSGVGSESSKSSKASIELRRAASMSKSSDSGSSSTSSNVDHQELFTLNTAAQNNLNNVCQDCDLIYDKR